MEHNPFENLTVVKLITDFPAIYRAPKFHHLVHNSKRQAHTNPEEFSRRPSTLFTLNQF
jgi:hypothetical protein